MLDLSTRFMVFGVIEILPLMLSPLSTSHRVIRVLSSFLLLLLVPGPHDLLLFVSLVVALLPCQGVVPGLVEKLIGELGLELGLALEGISHFQCCIFYYYRFSFEFLLFKFEFGRIDDF